MSFYEKVLIPMFADALKTTLREMTDEDWERFFERHAPPKRKRSENKPRHNYASPYP